MKNMQGKMSIIRLNSESEGKGINYPFNSAVYAVYYNQARRYEVGQFQQFQDQTYLSGNALAVTQSAGYIAITKHLSI